MAKDEPDKQETKSSGPKWLLVTSGVLNLLLAVIAGWASFAKSDAEAAKAIAETQKAHFERELLLQANLPAISTFHLMAELGVLRTFLDSKAALPFTDGITRFTFLENDGLARMQAELAELRSGRPRRGVVTFLVVANGSAKPAEDVVLHRAGRAGVTLGRLEANSAVLVPESFQPDRADSVIFLANPERIEYAARIGDLRKAGSREIVRQSNPLWTLSLGGAYRGFGRANVDDDEARGPAPPPE